MKITVVKDWRGVEEVHKAGCADLKKSRNRPYRLSEALTMDVENLGDMYRVYWECIDEENIYDGSNYKTKEEVWWAWRGEFSVKPCAASVPEMPEPGTEPAKITKSEAKNDLARRLVLAAGQIIDNADGSEAFLSALTVEEAAQFLANWLHSLPTGGRDGARWWPTDGPGSLPRPATADWKR
jgi:hypothetical protein